jgi:hypothetical protein
VVCGRGDINCLPKIAIGGQAFGTIENARQLALPAGQDFVKKSKCHCNIPQPKPSPFYVTESSCPALKVKLKLTRRA